MITEALIAILFPFEYTNMLIPVRLISKIIFKILPDVLKMYKEAPLPYLIGYSSLGEHPNQTDVSFI